MDLNLKRNETYESSHKLEKRLRGNLKAQTEKNVADSTQIVILDHGNYIKGWRYELHCMAKSIKQPSCVVYIENDDISELSGHNENRTPSEDKYSEKMLQELNFRYEKPNPNSRWDSPLFTISKNSSFENETDRLIPELLMTFSKTATQKIKQNNATIKPQALDLAGLEAMTQDIIQKIDKVFKIFHL